MPPRKSKVWIFFAKIEETDSVKCKVCSKRLKSSRNTTNMIQHLNLKHAKEFAKFSKEESLADTELAEQSNLSCLRSSLEPSNNNSSLNTEKELCPQSIPGPSSRSGDFAVPDLKITESQSSSGTKIKITPSSEHFTQPSVVKMFSNVQSYKRDLEQLKRYRENNDRKSREIMQIWEDSVSSNISSLGKERHIVLEQICIASVDCFRLNIAQRCIQELYKDFPNSSRVRILESMVYEADENYQKALQILNDIIKQDSTNSAAKKRKIAIYKALGKYTEAIKELTEYLKTFMADVEAWQELSEMYINEHDYGKAAFCVEELILHSPHNHLLHQRYADIKYTQGGLENLETARTYYYQALKLNPKNVRALYGIYLTTTALLNSQKNLSQKKKDSALKVVDWSLKQLRKRYTETNAIKDIEESLAALEI